MLRLSRALRRLGPWPPAVLAGLGILALAIGYAGPQAAGVGLDAELGAPAVFSSALLVLAAVAAAAVSLTWADRSYSRRVFGAFAGFLVFFAADDLLSLHARAESRTGIDWELLYLPVGAVGAAIALAVVVRLRDHPAVVALTLLAGLAWLVAVGLEAAQFHGAVLVHPAMTYPEELLEATGSALLLTALLLALRRRTFAADGPQDTAETLTVLVRR